MPPLTANGAVWFFLRQMDLPATTQSWEERRSVFENFSLKTDRISALLYFCLGDFVIHPDRPDWGIGQVQSIVGMNVTVNFEHAGKQMINCNIIALNAAPRPTK